VIKLNTQNDAKRRRRERTIDHHVAAVIFANDANSLVNDNPRDGIEQ
jgi:hypothetical protein